MQLQIALLILSLVAALFGTLAKTRDDNQASIRGRVKPSGWIIVGALLISFCLTVIETVKSAREGATVKKQNKELQANVSSLMVELAKNSAHVSTLLEQQGATGKQVSSLLDQLGETQAQLSRERSATVLTLFEGWEIVRDVTLRIESLNIEDADDRTRVCVSPFWFTPGLASYNLNLNPNAPSEGFLNFKEELPAADPAKDEQTLTAYIASHENNAMHNTYTAKEDYRQHNFALSGPKTLGALLYMFRTDWTPLIVKLTYRNPPAKEVVDKLSASLADKRHLRMQLLAPIEKKSALAERRKHLNDSASESKLPMVYWRVNMPLLAEKVEAGVGEGRTANDVIISLRIDPPFIEQDYDQESGP